MNSFESKNCLEECMKEIVTEVNKKVRDSILLGKARVLNVNYSINQNKTITDQNESDDENINNQYLIYKIKELRLSHTLKKKNSIEKNLLNLDQRIVKLKSQVDIRLNNENKNMKFNYNYLNYSPSMRNRVGKIPKMSDDIERRQKEIDAKKFVQKLNKEKVSRNNEEKKKLNNKLILIDDNSNTYNNENKTKLYLVLPKINKITSQIENSPNNGNNNSTSQEKVINVSPPNNANFDEDNKRGLVIYNDSSSLKRNGESIIQNNFTAKHVKQPNEKRSRLEESLFDNSISFKSIKKSPYFFNDPKYNKILEIKQKYNLNYNAKKAQKNEIYGDIKYMSDQNNISEEDYEIL